MLFPQVKRLLLFVGFVLVSASCDKNRNAVEIPGFTTASDPGAIDAGSDSGTVQPSEENWEPLLDEGLSKWERYLVPEEGSSDIRAEDVFSVASEDGELTLHATGKNKAALTSKKDYGDYHLSFEFKWGKKHHQSDRSGIIYHATGDFGEARGIWMKGLMFRISKGYNGGINALMNVRTKITANEIDAKTARFNPEAGEIGIGLRKVFRCEPGKVVDYQRGEWMKMEIYSSGQGAVHLVNGQRMLEHTGATISRKVGGKNKLDPLTSGKILIVLENGDYSVRDLKLRAITSLP